jgi:ADP-heptose:LPS heptosyltransferase
VQYMNALFEKYAAALYTPPFEAKVASNANTFLANTTLAQRVWRRFKRDLALALTGQLFCQHAAIPAKAKRVLYVYLGMPQLGDSIMDLSARTLWAQRGFEVDLFTHASIASFYEGDPSFARVLSSRADLAKSYDFVVLQSYNWKCLKLKWRYFLTTPFLALHGHYYGPEFNRFDFARHAWGRALDLTATQQNVAVNSVFNLKLDHQPHDREQETIALALGGVVSWRTYSRWFELIAHVQRALPQHRWLLLGAENGLSSAGEVMSYFEETAQTHLVENCVNQLTLTQVFKRLQKVALLVTADGGLLHLGKAAQAPMVALMAGPIHPIMRFGGSDLASVIYAPAAVDDIDPMQVAQAVEQSVQGTLKSLQVAYIGLPPDCS